MSRATLSALSQVLILVLIAGLPLAGTGCATMVSGAVQTVTVKTTPAGRTVYFEGSKVADGERVTITKRFQKPQFNVGTAERPVMVDLGYGLDPWLLGDCGLAIFYLVPGIIAGGIDVATGCWRKIDDIQRVSVPN